MGRRGIKEYRAPEALALIAADRDQQPLVCPCCGGRIERVPRRHATAPAGKVTLHCSGCGRHAAYLPMAERPYSPEAPPLPRG